MNARARGAGHALVSLALVTVALASTTCQRGTLDDCRAAIASGKAQAGVEICGSLYRRTGNPRAAFNTVAGLYNLGRHDEALVMIPGLDGTVGEAPGQVVAGSIYQNRNDLTRAQAAFARALGLARAAGDDHHALEAAQGLYVTAASASRFHEAWKALEIVEGIGRRTSTPAVIHRTLISQAQLLREIGDLDGMARALSEARRVYPDADPVSRASRLLREGLLELDRGNNRASRAINAEAETIAQGAGATVEATAARLNRGEAALRLGDLKAAAADLAALPDETKLAALPPSLQVERLALAARLELAGGRPAAAVPLLERALALAPGDEWRWMISLWRGLAAEGVGDLVAAERAFRAAVDGVEAMRSTFSGEDHRSWFLGGERKPHAALIDLYTRTGRQGEALEMLERAQARTFIDRLSTGRSSNDPAEATRAAEERTLADSKLRKRPEVQPRPAQALLRAVRGHNVLMFYDDVESVRIFSIRKGELAVRKLGTSARELRSMAQRFASDPAARELGRTLSRALLPADLLPSDGEPLFIVPGEAFGLLPFSALRKGERHLIEAHELAVVPSLTSLVMLEQALGAGPSAQAALVLGDPSGDLTAAASEAKEVAQRLGVQAHIGKTARSDVMAVAGRPSVIHFATHSGVGAEGSWLELADGRFAANDILGWRIRPDLVVLASCASGATRHPDLWGSLATAFLLSGSRAVLASLRTIDDRQARDFVFDFYQAGGALQPRRALAHAQRLAIAKGAPAHSWASFVLYGVGERSADLTTLVSESQRRKVTP